MRKAIYFLVVFTSLIFGCSPDSSSDLGSRIKFGEDNFSPDYLTYANPTGHPLYPTDKNFMIFYLLVDEDIPHYVQRFQISIEYPLSKTDISGTYTFGSSTSENKASASYNPIGNLFWITSGTMAITDLGNNKFRLQFNEGCLFENSDSTIQKTVTGYIERDFIPRDFVLGWPDY